MSAYDAMVLDVYRLSSRGDHRGVHADVRIV